MKHIITSASICLVLFCSCKNSTASNSGQTTVANAQQDTLPTFTLPEIPPMYTDPEQRADFLVKHYWDNFNFNDTNYIHHPEVTEQAWSDYVNILYHVPLQTGRTSIKETIKKTETERKVFDYFIQLADKYLYDPNSPFRNEEFYISVLEAMIETDAINDAEKIRPKSRLELALKNRLGEKALDFTYTLLSGKQGSLYAIHSEYTLIFFNNPGCHSCEETINEIKNSALINHLLSAKKLTILSIYPDEELDEWKKHLSDFPKEWINGYDKEQTIRYKNLYDLKAIPTLYLLDKNKTVLLKDAADIIQITDYLEQHTN